MTETAETLTEFCQERGRVCPAPSRWHELWEMLPERERVGSGWKPPLPLILGAWNYTSDLEKMLRLREHIEWAANHGCLPTLATFLRSLPETEWHHLPG
jgi:hypothetical protein